MHEGGLGPPEDVPETPPEDVPEPPPEDVPETPLDDAVPPPLDDPPGDPPDPPEDPPDALMPPPTSAVLPPHAANREPASAEARSAWWRGDAMGTLAHTRRMPAGKPQEKAVLDAGRCATLFRGFRYAAAMSRSSRRQTSDDWVSTRGLSTGSARA